jgi:hypothetical protein
MSDMAMDFNYTVVFKKRYGPNERNVYHVLHAGCPASSAIKAKHQQFRPPPPDEHRRLCDKCIESVRHWIGELPADDRSKLLG